MGRLRFLSDACRLLSEGSVRRRGQRGGGGGAEGFEDTLGCHWRKRSLLEACLGLSSSLEPIPPPCLGCRSEASRMPVGVSWDASGEPLGGSFGATCGGFGGLLLGLMAAFWGLLGPS